MLSVTATAQQIIQAQHACDGAEKSFAIAGGGVNARHFDAFKHRLVRIIEALEVRSRNRSEVKHQRLIDWRWT